MKVINEISKHGLALLLISQYRWLRPQEMALLLLDKSPSMIKYSEQICRDLLNNRLLIARRLPSHSGTAFVLSQRGGQLLSDWHEGRFGTGKDLGEMSNGAWIPPTSWRHDLMAAGLLGHLRQAGWQVCGETMLRRENNDSLKHPDGLAFNPADGKGYWIEVENSEKKGGNMIALARALVLAARSKPVTNYDSWNDKPIRCALVGIDKESRDKRGCHIDHWSRIRTAIQKLPIAEPVAISIGWLSMRGQGVSAIELEEKIINP